MDWAHRTEEVPRITTAGRSPREELAHRQRRYVLSMTIRTLCFIGAVFARSIPWLCIILIVASFALPYVAVVMANSASPSVPGDPVQGPGKDTGDERKELE